MCGIAGILRRDPAAVVDRSLLQRMTRVIAHRGPDGESLHFDAGVGLGHRRLSIIDLEGGTQPIFSADGALAIIFNGEIYNYKEIRSQLERAGFQFKTRSDTEVIVHLYNQVGADCVHSLNGMFAFAIWDNRSRTLFAARDRLGEKPFYYSSLPDGSLAFASEIKSLLEYDRDAARKLDPEAIDEYFAYGYVASPRSIYAHIRKLPAAHTLTWNEGRISVARYWSHLDAVAAPAPDAATLLRQVEDLVRDSIRLRLRSDVPVGAFLSGGIDSSLIVAMASEVAESRLATFTVGFTEKDFDESPYARAVAERYGTEHHELIVGDINLDMFPDLVRQFDEPFADPSAIPTYYVTRAASQHLKVCLSGDAGDELFAGYPQYVLEPAEAWVDRVPPVLRRLLFGVPAAIIPDHVRGKGWLSRMSVDGAVRYQRTIGILDDVERRALLKRSAGIRVDRGAALLRPYFTAGRPEIEARILADQGTWLTDDILVKVDRNSMMNSLEVRVPFLDHRLVELANAMPLSLRMKDGKQKWILKALLESRVPAGITDRPKQGFGMPIRDWLRGSYRGLAEDLLLNDSNPSFEYVDPVAVRRLFDAHQRGSRDLSDRLWSLMWFEQWCRTFVGRT
jgi:asparagine synthase (glutamine-hydrolysing)